MAEFSKKAGIYKKYRTGTVLPPQLAKPKGKSRLIQFLAHDRRIFVGYLIAFVISLRFAILMFISSPASAFDAPTEVQPVSRERETTTPETNLKNREGAHRFTGRLISKAKTESVVCLIRSKDGKNSIIDRQYPVLYAESWGVISIRAGRIDFASDKGWVQLEAGAAKRWRAKADELNGSGVLQARCIDQDALVEVEGWLETDLYGAITIGSSPSGPLLIGLAKTEERDDEASELAEQSNEPAWRPTEEVDPALMRFVRLIGASAIAILCLLRMFWLLCFRKAGRFWLRNGVERANEKSRFRPFGVLWLGFAWISIEYGLFKFQENAIWFFWVILLFLLAGSFIKQFRAMRIFISSGKAELNRRSKELFQSKIMAKSPKVQSLISDDEIALYSVEIWRKKDGKIAKIWSRRQPDQLTIELESGEGLLEVGGAKLDIPSLRIKFVSYADIQGRYPKVFELLPEDIREEIRESDGDRFILDFGVLNHGENLTILGEIEVHQQLAAGGFFRGHAKEIPVFCGVKDKAWMIAQGTDGDLRKTLWKGVLLPLSVSMGTFLLGLGFWIVASIFSQ